MQTAYLLNILLPKHTWGFGTYNAKCVTFFSLSFDYIFVDYEAPFWPTISLNFHLVPTVSYIHSPSKAELWGH